MATADHHIPEFEQQLFIETWARQAVQQMRLYGIPASITLAQAIVESGWGRGTVALQGNNYFCIKGNNGWAGPVVEAMDDDSVESVLVTSNFRKYGTIEESFADHARFLQENRRYQPLFSLGAYDYKAWAYGLKAANYATKADYAEYLIATIEKYGLYLYDYAVPADEMDTLKLPFQVMGEAVGPPTDAPVFEVQAPETQLGQPPVNAGQPMLQVPGYQLDKAQRPSAPAHPTVDIPDAKTFVRIPLILPKAAPRFERR